MIRPVEILKSVFGYDSFRQNQEEIIEHALADQDALVIMPTGGGKSICFQIPAIIKPNLTLVISPLISLMKDQVESIRANGVDVAYYNSSMTDSQRLEVRRNAVENKIKLLYLSPETLISSIDWIKQLKIDMIAVDEAHCVSMWGHDFRPEYQQIGELRKHFKNKPMLAFTATADKITRKDISEKLSLQNPTVFISSFDRPNLSLAVRSQVPKKDKQKEVVNFIKSRGVESGIIYCLSRKETEEWSNYLNSRGISSRYYHAGMPAAERDAVQEGFINDSYDVICATIAFGMGIDKSNVRWVIHNNLPKNIEGFYQEIGRAGRDGMPSETILYFNYRDVVLQKDFVKESDIKEVYHEKINRMLQYAESSSCRRRILLAYFGEHLTEDCGNCDICDSPPIFIDGTVIAQKALSAASRTNQSVGINLLVNVLRGAQTMDIFEQNLHQIKTYGAGKEYSFKQWQHFINQLINLGAFEIAYDDNMKLKVTSLGDAILKGNQEIKLPQYEEKDLTSGKKKKSSNKQADDDVVTALKLWRKEKAAENKVPAYVILHDNSVDEIAKFLPADLEALQNIQGLGKVKIQRFGAEIISIVQEKGNKKISTYQKTLNLYRSGLKLDQIAEARNLSSTTILNHLIKLYEEGKRINLYDFITEFEIQQVKTVRTKLSNTYQLKPIHDELKGELPYEKISVAIAILDGHH
ncbi:DNA helicase RecQ [Paracrocinitomix mangrovi]|uniref:DNA helicase RecQ n=1 Tax=Paracrocinitomix mangrovi TaxID=2862509 RepID=UPI001C8E0FBA|nr:DNA helicase RecQ [Paracrocinitomix mangrovi]UKN02439.1 DNA helicase RecQ [Paracrocinitomix mangrovi]